MTQYFVILKTYDSHSSLLITVFHVNVLRVASERIQAQFAFRNHVYLKKNVFRQPCSNFIRAVLQPCAKCL